MNQSFVRNCCIWEVLLKDHKLAFLLGLFERIVMTNFCVIRDTDRRVCARYAVTGCDVVERGRVLPLYTSGLFHRFRLYEIHRLTF